MKMIEAVWFRMREKYTLVYFSNAQILLVMIFILLHGNIPEMVRV